MENYHLASDEVDVILRFLISYKATGSIEGLWYTFNEHVNLVAKLISLSYLERVMVLIPTDTPFLASTPLCII